MGNSIQTKAVTKEFDLLRHRMQNDFLLVEPVEPDNDIFTPNQYEDKPTWGRVVNIANTESGIVAGSIVLFGEYAGVKVRVFGKDYIVLHIGDIYSAL